MRLSAVTIFLSAFLLYQIQPMIAKMILSWFGGSAAVWSDGAPRGYLYAQWLSVCLRQRARPRSMPRISGSEDPVPLILGWYGDTRQPFHTSSSRSPKDSLQLLQRASLFGR